MTADDWSSICKILTSIDAAFRHPERSAEFCQQALGEARRLHNAASLSVAGDDVERLIEARKVVAKEYRRLGLNPNPVLRGDFDAGVEVQAALRSQYNKVSKPL